MLNNRIIIETMAHLFSVLGQDYFEPCELPEQDGYETIQASSYSNYIKCLRNPDSNRATEAYYITPTGTYKINPFLVLLLNNNYIQFKGYSVIVRNHYHDHDGNVNTVETKLDANQLSPLHLIHLIGNPYISYFEYKCELGVFYRSSEYYQDTHLLDYSLKAVFNIHYHEGFTGNRHHLKSNLVDLLVKYENTYTNLVHLTKGDFE